MTGLGPFLAGFIAGEATFTTRGRDRAFRFAVSLGATDKRLCAILQAFFGVGHLVDARRRRSHYDDECAYVVSGSEQLAHVIVPFMDAHPPRDSYKWAQYERWRDELLAYRAARTRVAGGRVCSVDGCGERARAKGLCRRHYFAAYRR